MNILPTTDLPVAQKVVAAFFSASVVSQLLSPAPNIDLSGRGRASAPSRYGARAWHTQAGPRRDKPATESLLSNTVTVGTPGDVTKGLDHHDQLAPPGPHQIVPTLLICRCIRAYWPRVGSQLAALPI